MRKKERKNKKAGRGSPYAAAPRLRSPRWAEGGREGGREGERRGEGREGGSPSRPPPRPQDPFSLPLPRSNFPRPGDGPPPRRPAPLRAPTALPTRDSPASSWGRTAWGRPVPAPPPGAGDLRPGRRRPCATAGTRGETCCGRCPARLGLAARPPLCSHRAPLSHRCRRPRLRSETNPGPARRSRRAPPAAHPREGPAWFPRGPGRLLCPAWGARPGGAAAPRLVPADRELSFPGRCGGGQPSHRRSRVRDSAGGCGSTRSVRVPTGHLLPHSPPEHAGPQGGQGHRRHRSLATDSAWTGSGERRARGRASALEPALV